MQNKLILASKSPRRQELLKNITEDFICIVSDVVEDFPDSLDIHKAPEFLARKKATAVLEENPLCTVIGCDTGVFIDGKMLGKPKDKENAKEMLMLLSGRTHKVITGCCICNKEKIQSFSTEVSVKFREMSEKEIIDYIASGDPMDKAGAYGIQGKGAIFIESINGDYYSVMGLPLCKLSIQLRDF